MVAKIEGKCNYVLKQRGIHSLNIEYILSQNISRHFSNVTHALSLQDGGLPHSLQKLSCLLPEKVMKLHEWLVDKGVQIACPAQDLFGLHKRLLT